MDVTEPIDRLTIPATRRPRISFAPAVLDMLAVTFAGALVRLGSVLTSTFPLHDGGLFVVMIRDIRAAGMMIPATTTYNGGGIPFDYPPLAFWVAALLPADPVTIVRFAGPLAAVLTVPMVYLLALELLPGRPYAYVSALLYAVVPRSWDFLVAGGGVTRAPGLLLGLVGVWMMLRMYRTRRPRYAAGAAIFGGLAVLTHPEAAVFVAATFVLLALVRVRDKGALISTVWVAVGVFLVALPWPLLLASQGHLLDLVHVAGHGGSPLASITSIAMWSFSGELYAQGILALGSIGLLALAQRRSPFIVLWLLAEVCLAVRGAATFACVPLAMAASVGLYDGIGQGILRIPSPDVFRSNAVRGVLLLVLAWSTFNVCALFFDAKPPFDGLSASGVSTMAWLKANTPSDASFAVVSGQPWPDDVYGEWLPALTDRRSVATIQGREWGSRAAWDDALASYDALQMCVHYDAECVVSWTRAHATNGPAYVYVVESLDSHALRLDIEASPKFRVVHAGDDGVVAILIAGP